MDKINLICVYKYRRYVKIKKLPILADDLLFISQNKYGVDYLIKRQKIIKALINGAKIILNFRPNKNCTFFNKASIKIYTPNKKLLACQYYIGNGEFI